MSRLFRGAAIGALAAAGVLAMAGAANAQTYGRLVVFGDSLSDNGNLYALTGSPTSPPYYQGRFSNGPVFTELLGFNAGRYTAGASVTGSVNYAFGGARTDSSALPPGMRNQLLAYLGGGGLFGPNDLVSVLGGANNIFQALPAAGASANPTAAIAPVATAAAGDINYIVGQVSAAGAGTILVTNLPKLSITPQFGGTPAAPLADYAVTTFNSALLTGLHTTAASTNTNIIYMDLFKAGDAIASIASDYGITNVTQACFGGISCTDPDSYLYWDGVHPTAAGHRIIADLANDYLYYGDRGAETTTQAETGYRHREGVQDMIGESLSSRHGWDGGTRLSASVSYESSETGARGSVGESESDGLSFSGALDAGLSENLRVGLGVGVQNSEVQGVLLRYDVESISADIWAGWRSGNMFVNGSAGISNDNYDSIERATGLGRLVHSAETGGSSRGARLQGGWWFDMGDLAVSPRLGVSYVSTKVDGYYEQGAAAQYQYADRTIEALSGEVALRVEGGGDQFGFYVEGGYRDAIDESFDDVVTGIAGNPATPLAREFHDPMGKAALLSFGVSHELNEAMSLDVGYRGRFGEDTDSHIGGITLKLKL